MNVPVDPYGYPIIPPPLPRQVPQNQYYALPAPPPAPAHMQLVPYQQLRLEHYVDPAHPPVLPMVSQGSDGRVVAIGVAGPPNPTEEEAARAARMQQLIDELNATHQAQGYLQSRLQGTAYQPAQSVRDDGTHSDSHMHTRRGSREAAAYPPPSQSFSSNSSAPFSQRPVGSGIPSLRHTRTMPELRYDTDPLPQGRWGHDFGSLSASIASIAEEDEEATPTMAPAMLASVRGAVSEQPRRRSAERDAPTTPTPRGRMGRGHRRRASSDVERERKGGVQL